MTKVLIRLSNVILPGKGIPEGPFVTEEEIRAMADVASEDSSIEEEEKELIHSIFEFGDTLVREVMVPRPDMTVAPVEAAMPEVLDLILQKGYSRIPVYRATSTTSSASSTRRTCFGTCTRARATCRSRRSCGRRSSCRRRRRSPTCCARCRSGRSTSPSCSDEYGSTAGLITIEDLLEEIVGEIADEYDREEPEAVPLADGRYRVDGRMSVDDLNDLLDVELPNEEWDTVAGLMYGLLGAVPTQGEQVPTRTSVHRRAGAGPAHREGPGPAGDPPPRTVSGPTVRAVATARRRPA